MLSETGEELREQWARTYDKFKGKWRLQSDKTSKNSQ